MNKQAHYANYLGKKILIDGERVGILKGVYLDTVTYVSETPDERVASIADVRIIVNDLVEQAKYGIPNDICVFKSAKGNYLNIEDFTKYSNEDALAKVAELMVEQVNKKLNWSLTMEEFFTRDSRKRPLLWMRQIYMILDHKVVGLSQAQAALKFNKDHATVINSMKTVGNLIETDFEWRTEHENIFRQILSLFPNKKIVTRYFDFDKFNFTDDGQTSDE